MDRHSVLAARRSQELAIVSRVVAAFQLEDAMFFFVGGEVHFCLAEYFDVFSIYMYLYILLFNNCWPYLQESCLGYMGLLDPVRDYVIFFLGFIVIYLWFAGTALLTKFVV